MKEHTIKIKTIDCIYIRIDFYITKIIHPQRVNGPTREFLFPLSRLVKWSPMLIYNMRAQYYIRLAHPWTDCRLTCHRYLLRVSGCTPVIIATGKALKAAVSSHAILANKENIGKHSSGTIEQFIGFIFWLMGVPHPNVGFEIFTLATLT